MELFDKHVQLPSALNVHYQPDAVYTGLMQLSVNGGYAESTMTDLRLRYGIDAPCGGAFLYRLKKLDRAGWDSRLREVNDAVLSVSARLGLLDRPVACAIDYTKVPYYGEFNRYVTRSKHERGTDRFYEYATMSIVQNGVRLCVYSMPVTLLDVEGDAVKRLVEEAEERGVKIRLLLMDRAFFTTECINLLEGVGVDFMMPCVCNERVQAGSRGLVREGGEAPFLDPRQLDEEGGVLHDGRLLEQEGEARPLRHQRRGQREEAGRDDTEGVQEEMMNRDLFQEC